MFWKKFQQLYKNKQTEVGNGHQISGEPVSIVIIILTKLWMLTLLFSHKHGWLIRSALAWVELKGIWNGTTSGPFQMEAKKQ